MSISGESHLFPLPVHKYYKFYLIIDMKRCFVGEKQNVRPIQRLRKTAKKSNLGS